MKGKKIKLYRWYAIKLMNDWKWKKGRGWEVGINNVIQKAYEGARGESLYTWTIYLKSFKSVEKNYIE